MGELSDQVWLDRKRVAEALGYSETTVARRIADPESPLEPGVKRDGKTFWPHEMVEAQRRHELAQAGCVEEYKPLTAQRLRELGQKATTSVLRGAMNPAMMSFMKVALESTGKAQRSGGRPSAPTADAMRHMQARLAIAVSPRGRTRTPLAPSIGALNPLDPEELMTALKGPHGQLRQGEDGYAMNREITRAVMAIVERRLDDPVNPDPVLAEAVEALCEQLTRSLTNLNHRRYEQRQEQERRPR